MFYKLKNDIINFNMVKIISIEDNISPFNKDKDKDSWESEGNFKIIVDDREYSYQTLKERETVYLDIIQKLQDCNQSSNIIYTDKQALSIII